MPRTPVKLPSALLDHLDNLAQQLGLSRQRVIELALEAFIRQHADLCDSVSAHPVASAHVVINQGDVFWVQVDDPGIPHPHVVIQHDVLNHSRVDTVVTCAVTSNINRVSIPGNVLLEAAEANLPRASVVETSKVRTVAKAQLGDYIGSLSAERVQQIEAGLRFVQVSFLTR